MPPPDQDAKQSAGEEAGSGFLSRWSRRKVQVRQGVAPAEPVPPQAAPLPAALPERPLAAAVAAAPPDEVAAPASIHADTPPAPTLADVAVLTPESDYTRFVAPGVDTGVKNAALKKLFTDPHFNVMDGLDTYIDDYGQPDPLPAGMLRQMAQSHALGLFADEPPEPAPASLVLTDVGPGPEAAHAVCPAHKAAPDADPDPDLLQDCTPDENADLRLQPHDAAGPAGPGPSPGQGAGGQHRRD